MSTKPAPEEMSRDDLEAEVCQLRDDVEFIQERLFRLEDFITGDVDLAVAEEGPSVLDRLTEEANTGVSPTIDEGVRERMVPIHQMWLDVREGRTERISTDSQRRAARLFGRFIKKAAGESDVGVEHSYGKLKMFSGDARQVLEGAQDITASGKTVTIKRAMRAVQQFSKTEDCGCESIESCPHGLVKWFNDGGHKLVADADEFVAVMERVQAAVDGELQPTDDDVSGATSEAQPDVDAEFEQLERARVVSTGENDEAGGAIQADGGDDPSPRADAPLTEDTDD